MTTATQQPPPEPVLRALLQQPTTPPPLATTEEEEEVEEPPASATEASTAARQELYLELLENWGDKWYMGLTGIEVLDGSGRSLPLGPEQVRLAPSVRNAHPGSRGG